MSDFLHHLRFWLIAALFLGVSVGVLLRGWPEREGRQRWLAWTGVAALTGLLALALDAAASVIRDCPAGDLTVSAQGDAPGQEGQALGRRRTDAVIRYLNREGLDDRRTVASETEPSTVFMPGAVRVEIRKF